MIPNLLVETGDTIRTIASGILENSKLILDGVDMFMITPRMWDDLPADSVAVPVGETYRIFGFTSEQYLKMIEFCRKHNGFCVAFFNECGLPPKALWIPVLLITVEQKWVRVSIENARCKECQWEGLIANPTLPWLFDRVEDRKVCMKGICSLKKEKCPKCHHSLPRSALWVSDA